jgi:TatD DNase family protein
MKRAHSAGVREVLCASQSVPDSRETVVLCRRYEGAWCAVGVHPHEADHFRSIDVQSLKDLLIEPKVKAIGEIGLDFFRGISSRANQETAFTAQIELARMLDMPMVIHMRDAANRTRAIMEEHGYFNGVVHCFSGDKKFAEWAIEKGLYISFAGNFTYGEERLADVARMVPRDRLMVETDAPYLAPGTQRGQRNEPAFLRLTLEAVAAVLGTTPRELAATTRESARRCFRI